MFLKIKVYVALFNGIAFRVAFISDIMLSSFACSFKICAFINASHVAVFVFDFSSLSFLFFSLGGAAFGVSKYD